MQAFRSWAPFFPHWVYHAVNRLNIYWQLIHIYIILCTPRCSSYINQKLCTLLVWKVLTIQSCSMPTGNWFLLCTLLWEVPVSHICGSACFYFINIGLSILLIAGCPAIFGFLSKAESCSGAIEFSLYSTVRCGRWLALGASRWKQGLLQHTPLSRFILFKDAVGKAAIIKMKAVADEVSHPPLTPHPVVSRSSFTINTALLLLGQIFYQIPPAWLSLGANSNLINSTSPPWKNDLKLVLCHLPNALGRLEGD